ncbi:MAG: DedA family protein [Candidatus Dojkabacteria bacterium]
MGLTDWIINLVSTFGYLGVIAAMVIESSSIPLPSEVIMGIAGYLVYKGELNLLAVGLAGAIGNLIGSSIMYGIGVKGGRPLIKRFGHKVHMDEERFNKVDTWFKKYGDKVIFFSQLLPIVRTFVSLPAGILKINYIKFVTYTFTGAFIWCFLLAFISSQLGNTWEVLLQFMHQVELGLIVLGGAAIIGYIIYRMYKRKVARI